MDYLRHAAGLLSSALGLNSHDDENQQSEKASHVRPHPSGQPSPDDVIKIALLLRQKLPGDLIPLILDFAQLWEVKNVAHSLRPDRVGELQAPKLQAALIVPSYLPQGAVRRIRFIIDSRDQGWSSYPEDHGTYRGSWTWFEAGIRGLDASNADDQATLLEPVDCQHRNALDVEHRRLCLQDATRYKYGSRRIVTNVHAGRDFKKHVVEWDLYHEDDDVRSMVKELKGGHRIEVGAHARFPGWCNYVESVTVEIECAMVRRM
ncbi:hypothetical protein OHC33_007819 [Knufia fluminis]|uniref:Uncharacterized protein n=1 Tax=Knufia fluminis TaxID=191047 RepID=A0AAN8I614_9EURO|nr:hypothetical protein OHC33_007819 [Knufia fluminis]